MSTNKFTTEDVPGDDDQSLSSEAALMRTSFKLSTLLSNEEIREAIANCYGLPIELIPDRDYKAELREIRDQSSKVDSKIAEYKIKLDSLENVSKDKYEELHDIGRYIIATGNDMKILVPTVISNFPDFIVEYSEKMIGLEHTRLIDQEAKATIKTAKYFIERAEVMIKGELDSLGKTVNIFIDYEEKVIGDKSFKTRGFTAFEREQIPYLIYNYIKSILLDHPIQKPQFINEVKVIPNKESKTDLVLAESYITKANFESLLRERIAAKEVKASNYRKNLFGNEVWLIVIADDINSFSGFEIKSSILDKIEDSNFEKIELFEKFGGKTFTLFNKTPS